MGGNEHISRTPLIFTHICGISSFNLRIYCHSLCVCVRALCVFSPSCRLSSLSTDVLSTVLENKRDGRVAGCTCQKDIRASLLSTKVTCLMLSFSYQRNGFIAFDILLLELIRWLIIINTIFFCCCLHLIEHLLLYALVSFKLSAVFWLL